MQARNGRQRKPARRQWRRIDYANKSIIYSLRNASFWTWSSWSKACRRSLCVFLSSLCTHSWRTLFLMPCVGWCCTRTQPTVSLNFTNRFCYVHLSYLLGTLSSTRTILLTPGSAHTTLVVEEGFRYHPPKRWAKIVTHFWSFFYDRCSRYLPVCLEKDIHFSLSLLLQLPLYGSLHSWSFLLDDGRKPYKNTRITKLRCIFSRAL